MPKIYTQEGADAKFATLDDLATVASGGVDQVARDAAAAAASTAAGKYSKPASGIPSTDLTSSVQAALDKANAIGDLVTSGRLSEPALNATFVQFRNFDGSAVAAGSVVVVTLTEDGTDIHDITVEEA